MERSITVPLVFSLLLHAVFLPIAAGSLSKGDSTSISRDRVTRVRLIPAPMLDDHAMESKNGQVVDILDSAHQNNSAPKNARFLSDRNREVEKETQARQTGLSQNQNGPKGDGHPDLSLPKKFKGIGGNTRPLKSQTGSGQAGTGLGAFVPPSNYLPEIAYGDETLLNTREYAYSSFFVRMKRQMEAVWSPLEKLDRNQVLKDTYITAVYITLQSNGYVDTVSVESSSGELSLDNEALRAVRKGGPFLNPPEALVSEDGKIHIGPWRFIVSLKGHL